MHECMRPATSEQTPNLHDPTHMQQSVRQTDRQIGTDRFVVVDARDVMQPRNRGEGGGGRADN